MVGFENPENVNNLTFWLDASDPSTINNGKVLPNQVVTRIVDKVGGLALTSPPNIGWLGPTYAISSVNGNNAINFTALTPGQDQSRRSLINTAANFLGSAEKTLVFVHRPSITTTITKFPLSIWGNGRIQGTGFFPNIYLLNGSQNNPYSQYGEVPGTITGTGNIYEWNHVSYEQGVKFNFNPDNNSTQIMIIRTKSGVNKFNFYQDKGFNSETLYFTGDGSISTGSSVIPASPIKLVLGAYHDSTTFYNNANAFEGFFCEMLYFNRYLRTAEINGLEQYLKMKWIG